MGWTVGEDGALVPPPARTVNSLPPDVLDRLPAAWRDLSLDDPRVANSLGQMGWTIREDGALVPPPTRLVNSLPQGIRDRLPVGLRDLPLDDPRVANYLGRAGWTIGDDGTFLPPPSPALFPEFRPFGGLFRLR